jgi:hypothetical protein
MPRLQSWGLLSFHRRIWAGLCKIVEWNIFIPVQMCTQVVREWTYSIEYQAILTGITHGIFFAPTALEIVRHRSGNKSLLRHQKIEEDGK